MEDGSKLSIPSMKPDLVLVMGNIRGRDFVHKYIQQSGV